MELIISTFSYFISLLINYDVGPFILHGKGLAGRKSGRSVSICRITVARGRKTPNKKIRVGVFRRMSMGAKSTFEEYQQQLDILGVNYKSKQPGNGMGQILCESGKGCLDFRFLSLYKVNDKSTKFKGLPSDMGYDYVFVVREECTEFNKHDDQDITMAVRDGKNIAHFGVSNPRSMREPFVKECVAKSPYTKELELTGQQFYQHYDKDTNILEIIHYTNYKSNSSLKPHDIAEFERLKRIDPVNYRVAGLGYPGQEEGMVFARYMEQIVKPLSFVPRHYTGGIDLGVSDTFSAHPTVACITGGNANWSKYNVLNEYSHVNMRDGPIDGHKLAYEICSFYDKMNTELEKLNLPTPKQVGIIVFIDWGNGGDGFTETLELTARRLKMDSGLKFTRTNKEIGLKLDRVQFTIMGGNQGWGTINPECEFIREQMEVMAYEDDSAAKNPKAHPELIRIGDDGGDSAMYSVMEHGKDIMSQNYDESYLDLVGTKHSRFR